MKKLLLICATALFGFGQAHAQLDEDDYALSFWLRQIGEAVFLLIDKGKALVESRPHDGFLAR